MKIQCVSMDCNNIREHGPQEFLNHSFQIIKMTYKETTDWMFSQLPMYQMQGASAYKRICRILYC